VAALSNALAVCAGRDETEARRRADAIGRDLDELRHDGLAGSPDEIVDKIGQYSDVGTSRIYLQALDLHDRSGGCKQFANRNPDLIAPHRIVWPTAKRAASPRTSGPYS